MDRFDCLCGQCPDCLERWRSQAPPGLIVWDDKTFPNKHQIDSLRSEWLDWCLRQGLDPATGLPAGVQVDLPKDQGGKPLPF